MKWQKFKKKPIVIEAIQFNPQDKPWPECVISWERGKVEPRDMSWGYIDTLEGKMHVQAGDWIIKGIKGEFYPCKSDIFEMTYEPIMDKEEKELKVKLWEILDEWIERHGLETSRSMENELLEEMLPKIKKILK